MKEGVHPKYFLTKVDCACGNTFTTRSTRQELKLEICGACHPIFTGKQKFLDSAGRIDKFLKKFDQAKLHTEGVKKKKEAEKLAVKRAADRAAAAKKAALATQPTTRAPKKPKVLSSRPVAKKSS
ncbi:MAG: 50S ribosomal protein L31 [Elusimicrobia bacterium]|nr:50S ribosomal protein L31 [Elusimicrobiota bacterium]